METLPLSSIGLRAEDGIFFFYGTLMHPDVIKRVIKNNAAHLSMAPAIIKGYCRLRVEYVDYPAMIPVEMAKERIDADLPEEQQHVQGVVVKGLTFQDIRRLDWFEGDDYVQQAVEIFPLDTFVALDSPRVGHAPESATLDLQNLQDAIPGITYKWCSDLSALSPTPWSYETFIKEALSRWN